MVQAPRDGLGRLRTRASLARLVPSGRRRALMMLAVLQIVLRSVTEQRPNTQRRSSAY